MKKILLIASVIIYGLSAYGQYGDLSVKVGGGVTSVTEADIAGMIADSLANKTEKIIITENNVGDWGIPSERDHVYRNRANYNWVSPDGNDAAAGTYDAPWKSWQKGFYQPDAGDTTYFKGGVYKKWGTAGSPQVYAGVYIGSDGAVGSYKCMFAYPGDVPILDCDTTSRTTYKGVFIQTSQYFHLKGLTVRNVLQKTDSSTVADGFYFDRCNKFIVENCSSYDNDGSGFRDITSVGDTIYYINCDSYDNYDPYTPIPNEPGGNADGFVSYNNDSNSYRSYSGCRAWNNSDDGFDTYWTDALVEYDNCWSFGNGTGPGGNGFKLGPLHKDFSPTTRRIVRNCLAYNNGTIGFAQNFLGGFTYSALMELYNNTSYLNGNDGFDFHYGNEELIFNNNIAFGNGDQQAYLAATDSTAYNSWDAGVATVTTADFLSVNPTGLDWPRHSDGSLPYLRFLRPKYGSDIIDAGVNVGEDWTGSAPDIGAYEYGDPK